MSSDQGYVLFHRRYWDHPLLKPTECTPLEAWVWLNMNAMHAARDVSVTNGRHRGTARLEAGQLPGSVRFLADKWGWSDKRVQRFLAVLKRDQLVTTETTTGQTIITLCNWCEDQRPFAAATTQTATHTTTQTTTKKKELKELKKNALAVEGFDLWWRNYPRKVAKQDAKRAYAKVIGAALISEPDLLAKAMAFAATWTSRPVDDRKFIPYPASWLNDGRYDDEMDATANLAATLPPVNPADFTDAEWQDNLRLFRKRGEWSPSWGAQPGEKGCVVPGHLVPVPEGSLRMSVAVPLRR